MCLSGMTRLAPSWALLSISAPCIHDPDTPLKHTHDVIAIHIAARESGF